jgi:hypothetical protein
MATYKDFLEEINVIIPGIARPIVTPAIERVVREFCETSKIWRHDFIIEIDKVMPDAVIDVSQICRRDLAALEAVLVDVTTVRIEKDRLPFNSFSRVARKGFVLKSASPASGTYTVTASLQPDTKACEVPDFLLDEWAVDIAYGVAYRLAMQPRQTWSDIQLAQEYKSLFVQGMNRAMFEANNERQSMSGGRKYTFY